MAKETDYVLHARLNHVHRQLDSLWWLDIGSSMIGLPLVVDDPEWKWAAVEFNPQNGKVILKMNRKYLASFTVDMWKFGEACWVMAHEALHVALDHFTRIGKRDHKKFNIVADLIINTYLNKNCNPVVVRLLSGIQDEIITYENLMKFDSELWKDLPADWYDTMSVEALYDWLEQREKELGREMRGDFSSATTANEKGHEAWEKAGGATRKIVQEKVMDQFRKHMGQVDPSDKDNEVPDYNSIGRLPLGELRKVAPMVLKIKGVWPSLFRNFLKSVVTDIKKNFGTYRFRSNMQLVMDKLGRLNNTKVGRMLNREKPSDPTMTHCIMFFIDASGSMNDNQLSKIMSIIHGTLPSEIERAYYSFDTEVYKLSGFHTMMGKKKPRPGEEGYFEPVGGGGTDLDCVITEVENMMRNKRKSVDGIVVFTDGYFQQVTLPHPEKWLFMLTADHSTSAIDASAKKPVKKYAMDENFFSFKGFMIEDASARSDAPPPEKKDMTPRDKLALLKKVLDAFKKFDIGVSDVKIAS